MVQWWHHFQHKMHNSIELASHLVICFMETFVSNSYAMGPLLFSNNDHVIKNIKHDTRVDRNYVVYVNIVQFLHLLGLENWRDHLNRCHGPLFIYKSSNPIDFNRETLFFILWNLHLAMIVHSTINGFASNAIKGGYGLLIVHCTINHIIFDFFVFNFRLHKWHAL